MSLDPQCLLQSIVSPSRHSKDCHTILGRHPVSSICHNRQHATESKINPKQKWTKLWRQPLYLIALGIQTGQISKLTNRCRQRLDAIVSNVDLRHTWSTPNLPIKKIKTLQSREIPAGQSPSAAIVIYYQKDADFSASLDR